MPVLFKGNSEYKRNYKWNSSYRSASFIPNHDQSANDAGVRSDQIFSSLEPSFSMKKKVWHRDPQIHSCLIWWPDSDSEGKKSDFLAVTEASDGKIQDDKSMSPLKKAVKERKFGKNKESKRAGHSSDSSIILKSNNDASKQRNSPAAECKKRSEDNKIHVDKIPSKKISSVDAPNIDKCKVDTTSKRRAMKQSKSAEIESLPKPNSSSKRVNLKQNHSDQKKMKHMPDTVQVTKNIPIERKAGLNKNKPPRSSKARMSEYQCNFKPPKLIVKQSPLISALDIVHLSSPAIPPHGGVKFRPTTEYVANFKGKDTSPIREHTHISPASPSMKVKVRDLQNSQQAVRSLEKKKQLKSEYGAQFEAVKEQHVKEIRKLAVDNKQKHMGTHIDPDHATQVASPNNRFWEASSNCSNGKNQKEEPEEQDDDEKWSKTSQAGSDRTESLDTETTIEVDSLEESSQVNGDYLARKLAWGEPEQLPDKISLLEDDKSESSTNIQSVLEGRVTTPRLQIMGGARRTHLDLTTPSIGGALLVSPERPASSGSSSLSNRLDNTEPIAGAPTYDAQTLLKGRPHKLLHSSLQSSSETLVRQQKPSSAKESIKRNTKSQKEKPPIPGPSMTRRSPSLRNVRTPIRGALKNEEFQHCGRLQSLPPPISRSDDVLSVASSLTSARASELLKKAKERKSFWTIA